MRVDKLYEEEGVGAACRLEFGSAPDSVESGASGLVEVVEFTDPGCIWAWSSEPTLRWLRHLYGDRLRWRRVIGVQIPSLEESFPGRDPVASAEEWRTEWLEVAQYTEAPLTGRLAWMHTSTRPADAAVKAAELQGPVVADAVLRRLREAVFVMGRPADTPARIADAVQGVPELNAEQLIDDLTAEATVDALNRDFEATRRPRREVISLSEPLPHPGAAKAEPSGLRYSFPTLVVTGPAGELVIPGWRSTEHYRLAFEAVSPLLRGMVAETLDADSALKRYRSLSPRDLDLLTGRTDPPTESVRIETATVPLWLSRQEATSRELSGASYHHVR